MHNFERLITGSGRRRVSSGSRARDSDSGNFPARAPSAGDDSDYQFVRPTATADGAACQCIALPDIQIRFPDGSRKRPDIAVFCSEPEEDTEVTVIPDAVIEIISKDYEAKDLVVGVPFYQQVGIKDIVVFDPMTGKVSHWQYGVGEKTYKTPAPLTFLCGCSCVV